MKRRRNKTHCRRSVSPPRRSIRFFFHCRWQRQAYTKSNGLVPVTPWAHCYCHWFHGSGMDHDMTADSCHCHWQALTAGTCNCHCRPVAHMSAGCADKRRLSPKSRLKVYSHSLRQIVNASAGTDHARWRTRGRHHDRRRIGCRIRYFSHHKNTRRVRGCALQPVRSWLIIDWPIGGIDIDYWYRLFYRLSIVSISILTYHNGYRSINR